MTAMVLNVAGNDPGRMGPGPIVHVQPELAVIFGNLGTLRVIAQSQGGLGGIAVFPVVITDLINVYDVVKTILIQVGQDLIQAINALGCVIMALLVPGHHEGKQFKIDNGYHGFPSDVRYLITFPEISGIFCTLSAVSDH